jgi:uncharacterized caspase-like protein
MWLPELSLILFMEMSDVLSEAHGHGVLDDQGQLFLAVRDTDSQLLSGTAIPASYITTEMNNSHSQRQVLVLDCCHSGAFARGTKSQTGSSVGTGAPLKAPVTGGWS